MSKIHCRKIKEIENRRVWNFLQLEKYRILPERKSLHEDLEKEAERTFQGECAAQKRLSEAQVEVDRREWERRNADIALYETTRHLESKRVELYQANQRADQAQREKSWLLGELDTRNKRLSWRSRKRLRNNWRITKNLLARSWKSSSIEVWWVLHATEKDFYSESAFGSDSGIATQCEFLERCTRIRWSWNSEQHWIIACSLIHGNHWVHQETLEGLLGTYWVPQETFLKIYLLDTGHLQHSCKTQRIWQQLLADWSQLVQAKLLWTNRRIEKNRRIVQYQLLDLPGVMEPGILFIVLEELIIKIVRWKIREIGARTCILIISLTPKTSSVGRSISRLKYPLTEDVLQSQCYGSKKWR